MEIEETKINAVTSFIIAKTLPSKIETTRVPEENMVIHSFSYKDHLGFDIEFKQKDEGLLCAMYDRTLERAFDPKGKACNGDDPEVEFKVELDTYANKVQEFLDKVLELTARDLAVSLTGHDPKIIRTEPEGRIYYKFWGGDVSYNTTFDDRNIMVNGEVFTVTDRASLTRYIKFIQNLA